MSLLVREKAQTFFAPSRFVSIYSFACVTCFVLNFLYCRYLQVVCSEKCEKITKKSLGEQKFNFLEEIQEIRDRIR